MTNKILDYLGNAHASHIHAGGRITTNKLFELLEPQKDEKILEIGFGTGATLLQMAAQSESNFVGYETSPVMYQKALQRIQFCKMSKKINVVLLEKKNKFPAPDNSFDRVYAESIIAIQEGTDFRDLLLEIKRVLKPNGVLLFNETIWLETTEKSEAERINEQCKMFFGIIQSSHEYLHINDWKNLLKEIGFSPQFARRIIEIPEVKEKVSLPVIKSELYTLFGKMKAFINPSLRREWKDYERNMASITSGKRNLMEGVIIKAIIE